MHPNPPFTNVHPVAGEVAAVTLIASAATAIFALPNCSLEVGPPSRGSSLTSRAGVQPGTLAVRKTQLVAIVDDDESVREALPDLLREFGYEAEAYSSAEEFLATNRIDQIQCLVLDIAMPGMSGLELQQVLADDGKRVPIIFITAHGDQIVRKHLKERGAVECLIKPFSDTSLLEALSLALDTK